MHDEFFDGSIGEGTLPEAAVRSDLVAPPELVVKSALDGQLVRLLTLHPDLQLRFRNNNLASMDESAKRQLLEDMRAILEVHSPVYEESLR